MCVPEVAINPSSTDDDEDYDAINYEGMSRAKDERCILARYDAQSSALL